MDAFEGLSIQATKHRPQPLPNPNPHTSTPSSPFTVLLPRLVASPSRVVDISVYYLLSMISESGRDQMLSITSASAPTHIQDGPYHVCKAHIQMIKVSGVLASRWYDIALKTVFTGELFKLVKVSHAHRCPEQRVQPATSLLLDSIQTTHRTWHES